MADLRRFEVSTEHRLTKILVISEGLRPDVCRRLDLVSDDQISFSFWDVYSSSSLAAVLQSDDFDAVLNLLPRTMRYLGFRQTLNQCGATTVEMNLGIYRKKLFTRLQTAASSQVTTPPGEARKPWWRLLASVFLEVASKFLYPPHFFLAAAPRNLRFPAIAKIEKAIISTFMQEEMRLCRELRSATSSVRYALFIDDAVGTSSDWEHADSGPPVPLAIYSREIQAALSMIESVTGLDVLIAGHPGSVSQNKAHSVFGPREVIYGQTSELIAGAQLILTHQSTAVFQGMYCNLPVSLLLTKSLNHTFYGSLVETLGQDAKVSVWRPWQEDWSENWQEDLKEHHHRRLRYLEDYVGNPSDSPTLPHFLRGVALTK